MKSLTSLVPIFSLLLVGFGIYILFNTYSPIVKNEIQYQQFSRQPTPTIEPIDTSFGIVIPKIHANAKVIANVDPFNSAAYQEALSRGVAHAQGTSFPGNVGNIFLFSHSSVDFFQASRYNSIFYLLSKLEVGDIIKLYYLQKEYDYLVQDKKIVNPKDINYLNPNNSTSQLTLMTCWPPGTTLNRLIVIALPKK